MDRKNAVALRVILKCIRINLAVNFTSSLSILILFLTCTANPVRAGSTGWTVKEPFNQKLFIENKGQFSLPGPHPDKVYYGACMDGLQYYFCRNAVWIRHLESRPAEEKDLRRRLGLKDDPEDEESEGLAKISEEFHKIELTGAGEEIQIIPEFKSPEKFVYPGSSGKEGIQAASFKRLTYQNIYPGIDMQFYFPEDRQGFKYNFILHPGADPSLIRMRFPLKEKMSLSLGGDLLIRSVYGDFTDHAPIAIQQQDGKEVPCSFSLRKGTVTFQTGPFDSSQTLLIDPWTTTPVFNGNNPYEVDWDNAGDCYVYGGIFPFQVIKLNSSGNPVWTYTTTFVNPGPPTHNRFGDFAVDHRTGSVYILEGYNNITGSGITKLYTNGSLAASYPGNIQFNEMWRAAFSSCTNQLVIAGGGTAAPSMTGSYVDTSLTNLTPVNILNYLTGYHDMWGLTVDNAGNCYMATAKSLTDPGFANNVLYKLPLPGLTPITWQTPDNYQFVECFAVNYTPGSLTGYSNGYNGMAMGGSGVYLYDSHVLTKWDPANGNLLGSQTVNGSITQTARRFAGLTADACDHVFLASGANIRQYNSLSFVNSVSAQDTIYDLSLNNNQILYACGKGFVSAIPVNITPCSNLVVTNHLLGCSIPASDSISVSGGVGPYTITWNTNPPQTGPVVHNLSPGTYIATIRDHSCTQLVAYDTVVITPQAGINVTATVHNVSCGGGNDGSITLQVTGNSAPTTFTWSNGDTTQNINQLTAGTYSLVIHNGNGCSFNYSYPVTQPSPIQYGAIASPLPCHPDTGHITLTITGGTPPYLVAWNTTPPQAGPTAYGLPAGNYSGTITDQAGCAKAFTAVSLAPPLLTVQVTVVNTSCGLNNGMVIANTSGGVMPYSYSWTPGGTSDTLNALTPGTYSVNVQDSMGCHTSGSGTVSPSSGFSASFSALDTTGCAPLCVSFHPVIPSGATCMWHFGDGDSSRVTASNHCYANPGTYPVSLTVRSGNCQLTTTHPNMVHVFSAPQAAFIYSPDAITILAPEVCFTNTSTGTDSSSLYTWRFGDSLNTQSHQINPCFSYPNPGSYCISLKVSSGLGCSDSVTHCIEVLPDVTIFVPNCFTPNGDGLNDFFIPMGEGIDPGRYELLIFDRWGELIWRTTQWGTGWDGRVKGGKDMAQEDVYVWKINCRDVKGLQHNLTGRVSLVK